VITVEIRLHAEVFIVSAAAPDCGEYVELEHTRRYTSNRQWAEHICAARAKAESQVSRGRPFFLWGFYPVC
jgi:hypothetical protein